MRRGVIARSSGSHGGAASAVRRARRGGAGVGQRSLMNEIENVGEGDVGLVYVRLMERTVRRGASESGGAGIGGMSVRELGSSLRDMRIMPARCSGMSRLRMIAAIVHMSTMMQGVSGSWSPVHGMSAQSFAEAAAEPEGSGIPS